MMANSLIKQIVDEQLASLLRADVDAWVDWWHKDGVFEFPFAPPGYPKVVKGKAAIADYMAGLPEKIHLERFDIVELHENRAGDGGVVEFTCTGTVVSTGRPYNQHYVAILKTKEGKLSLYRDFWNPLVAIEAFGSAGAFEDAFAGGEE
ncbi:nuclear transport factor 2 family protein [Exilibacterium tricleocarpae]|uniref:Nuclear transport factor 2 family protein n=2 Tax=Exilibacterium tricleocarpae TaxID=2591008 RepID=A0A545TNC9_9GAMM|nr:nuclear transport factor 2 family protein [Exilibacterium tricleocarpae]